MEQEAAIERKIRSAHQFAWEALEHIPGAFFTLDKSGAGLGLWVSKGILDSHHAQTRVRSKPGRGTVFRIFFPLKTGNPDPVASKLS